MRIVTFTNSDIPYDAFCIHKSNGSFGKAKIIASNIHSNEIISVTDFIDDELAENWICIIREAYCMGMKVVNFYELDEDGTPGLER